MYKFLGLLSRHSNFAGHRIVRPLASIPPSTEGPISVHSHLVTYSAHLISISVI
jgi:hypothetical protein